METVKIILGKKKEPCSWSDSSFSNDAVEVRHIMFDNQIIPQNTIENQSFVDCDRQSISDPKNGEKSPSLGITENKRTFLKNQRRKRYELMDVARDILVTDEEKNWDGLCKCRRCPSGLNVTIRKSEDKAFFSNVTTCKSVWVCPTCSAQRSTARMCELSDAVEKTKYSMFMSTLTLQHTREDDLQTLLDDLFSAWNCVLAGANRGKFRDLAESVGFVRGLEIRHASTNGFHPHFHILFFTELSPKELKKRLPDIHNFIRSRYIRKLHKMGYETYDKTVDTVQCDNVSGYLTKFAMELTYGQEKLGKNGSVSAFQLLARYQQERNPADAKVFLEYARATKGKRQLYYSKGLKKLLGIDEKTDDELVQEQEETAFLYSVLTNPQFKRIVTKKMRVDVLEQAERLPVDEFTYWLIEVGIILISEVEDCYKLRELYLISDLIEPPKESSKKPKTKRVYDLSQLSSDELRERWFVDIV